MVRGKIDNLLSEIEVTDAAKAGTVHMLVLDVHGAMLAGGERLTTDVALVLDPVHVHHLNHVMTGKLINTKRYFKSAFNKTSLQIYEFSFLRKCVLNNKFHNFKF